MKSNLKLVLLSIFIISCSSNYSPKPLGYHRIILEEKVYQPYSNNCPFTFLIPDVTSVIQEKENCWMDINYPMYNANIYLTYKEIDANLNELLEENHKLAYDHSIKSDGITEKLYTNPDEGIYGIMYDIKGNSASNVQFFVTDSTTHFLRGSLYFNNVPNADSIAPVKNYIQQDIQILMESLKWS
jgi:gliding motility-associated lipoprotein GldD